MLEELLVFDLVQSISSSQVVLLEVAIVCIMVVVCIMVAQEPVPDIPQEQQEGRNRQEVAFMDSAYIPWEALVVHSEMVVEQLVSFDIDLQQAAIQVVEHIAMGEAHLRSNYNASLGSHILAAIAVGCYLTLSIMQDVDNVAMPYSSLDHSRYNAGVFKL